MADETVIGQTPVQTQTEVQPTGTTPTTPPINGAETVEQLQNRLAIAERERNEAAASLLAANRAVEAGRKFEKFEEFQSDVMGKLAELPELKSKVTNLERENNDLKTILSGKAAVTPSTTSVPAPIVPPAVATAETERINQMFGTKLT